MNRTLHILLALMIIFAVASPTQADWTNVLDQAKDAYVKSTESNTSSSSVANLTSQEVVTGLKEALNKSVDYSTSFLGKKDGFLKNPDVTIPVPESLTKIETALRLTGQDALADEFVTSMNRAAEKAVPETASVLSGAIKKMSFDDAKRILSGPDNAATEYFRANSSAELAERIRPIVSEAMSSVNVTGYYNQFASAAQLAGFSGTAPDLEGYVTDKTLDGLFLIMEREEANIRENPVARTTDILKKVFGQ
ncbi:DUF4197 domain-containing protein [Oleidesulfovibrio sp.]|uniref:DUF4197 domain-containing protein n=1 Tax=Oleidesulfovibrio sp. TaxID=2909707 RepID=UPI003A896110